ncbi:MAG: SRPBCC family protein [Gammaproteobacteria bacterium]
MKIHRMHFRQGLALKPDQAWDFFSSPFRLNEITPDFFHVTVTSEVPEEIYAGLMVSYSMKAVFGIPMAWLSEISHSDKPRYFVYQQRIGPFLFWSHEVRLTEQDSGVILEDIVFYAMPLGWIGEFLHKFLIAGRLERIFAVRRKVLAGRWGLTH